MAVYLAQCLCPSRHCILAAAREDESGLCDTLIQQVQAWLETDVMNPWCALCGATADTWRYEVGRTRYATISEAEPALRAMEAAQVRTAELLKHLGLAHDEAPGTWN